MKPQIQSIFNWLREKPGNIIEIHNAALGTCIDKMFTAEKAEPHGSIEKYFEFLYTNGVRDINIVQKEKNGTSIKNKKAPYSYTLMREDTTPQNLFTSPEATQPMPVVTPGLMGAAESVGLSQAQVFSMHTAAERLPEVKADLQTYKNKCEALEGQVKTLERENLKYELGIAGREGGLEKILTSISDPETLKTLTAIFGAAVGNAKAQKQQPGLAQPNNLTESSLKNSLIKIIASDMITEDQAMYIYHVADRLRKGDADFALSLKSLLEPQKTATNE